MQADSDIEGRLADFRPFRVQLVKAGHHVQGGLRRQFGVRLIRSECAPVCHDAIADELVDNAVVTEDDIGHRFQIFVELRQ